MKIVDINKDMKIEKTAKVSDKDIPIPEDIAAYVESLKLYLKRGQVKDPDMADKIAKLPAPKQILRSFSMEEIRVLTETVGYLWKKISNNDIIEESKMERAPETLEGNYWMLTKGVILEGPNHYTIIKRNMNLFISLLDINAFAMHDRLASRPNDVIKLVLDHGAMRIFVNKGKIAYFQLADDTYTKWGRAKIKKYDFKKKITKVVDKRQPYKGWNSGIVIKI
jgi:hypothetical protein